MDGKGRTFQNVIVSERSFWVVQNEPGNEITGQFRSLEEAKRHALSGNMIYHARETTIRTATMLVD
jgi:hypothetical protein